MIAEADLSITKDDGVASYTFDPADNGSARLVLANTFEETVNVDVVDVFAEAKLFNAIKLYEAGKRNDGIWQMLIDNVRAW